MTPNLSKYMRVGLLALFHELHCATWPFLRLTIPWPEKLGLQFQLCLCGFFSDPTSHLISYPLHPCICDIFPQIQNCLFLQIWAKGKFSTRRTACKTFVVRANKPEIVLWVCGWADIWLTCKWGHCLCSRHANCNKRNNNNLCAMMAGSQYENMSCENGKVNNFYHLGKGSCLCVYSSQFGKPIQDDGESKKITQQRFFCFLFSWKRYHQHHLPRNTFASGKDLSYQAWKTCIFHYTFSVMVVHLVISILLNGIACKNQLFD